MSSGMPQDMSNKMGNDMGYMQSSGMSDQMNMYLGPPPISFHSNFMQNEMRQ